MNAELRTILLGLDALIRREILRLRARYQLSLNEFRGLYISDEQVDALVRKTAPDAVGSCSRKFLLVARRRGGGVNARRATDAADGHGISALELSPCCSSRSRQASRLNTKHFTPISTTT